MLVKKNNNKQNQRFLNLEILRLILSLWVIIIHCHCIKNKKIIFTIYKCRFHVPTFMNMSFYFFYSHLSQRNIEKIKQRFKRILIPYTIWPIIFLLFNNILFLFGYSKVKLTVKDYWLQLIFGRKIHDIFWFHFNLIILSLLFSIFSFIFKNNFLFILQLICILSYYLQYSLINIYYFEQYRIVVCHSLGLLMEMIPFAVIGLTLGSLQILNKIKYVRFRTLIFSFAILFFQFKFDIFINIKSFIYAGINLNIGSIFFLLGFSAIPIEKIKNQTVISFIIFMTRYTGGLYYLHPFIRNNIRKLHFYTIKKTFYEFIIIYVICYSICLIGSKIFKKTHFKYLFY